jgi:hypothetical protein
MSVHLARVVRVAAVGLGARGLWINSRWSPLQSNVASFFYAIFFPLYSPPFEWSTHCVYFIFPFETRLSIVDSLFDCATICCYPFRMLLIYMSPFQMGGYLIFPFKTRLSIVDSLFDCATICCYPFRMLLIYMSPFQMGGYLIFPFETRLSIVDSLFEMLIFTIVPNCHFYSLLHHHQCVQELKDV